MVKIQRPQQVRLDNLSSLPLDLLVQITKYLDPADIIRSQRVSKRWNEIFSNRTIIATALRQTLDILGLKSAHVPVSDAMTYFRWRHGLQAAQPIKKVFLPWSTPRKPNYVFYHSRRLCCGVSQRSNEVYMLDLQSGEKTTWPYDKWDLWGYITLSDRYLVLVSAAVLFSILSSVTVWDLRTSQRWVKHLRVSSVGISIEGDKVIIPNKGSSLDARPILVWDLNADRVQEVGGFRKLALWHVDANENTLIAFEINWDINPPEVQQTKWALTGRLIDRKQFHLPLRDREDVKFKFPERRCYRTCCHKTVTQLISRTEDHASMHLTYDSSIDQLSAQWIERAEPMNRKISMDVDSRAFLTSDIAYGWGRHPRQLAVYNAAEGTTTLRPFQLDSRQIIVRKLTGHPPSGRRRIQIVPLREVPIQAFGDHEVFGLASHEGAQLWFFNPNFVPDLPDAEPFLAMEESG